jgi:hypothetical protein
MGTTRVPAWHDLELRTLLAAVLALVAVVYVWKGGNGLRYPYYVVHASFAYANSWALGAGGASLRRVFLVLEGLSLLWFAACFAMGASMARGEPNGGTLVLVGLAVACLPIVPFLWALTRAFGVLTPEMAAMLVRTG